MAQGIRLSSLYIGAGKAEAWLYKTEAAEYQCT